MILNLTPVISTPQGKLMANIRQVFTNDGSTLLDINVSIISKNYRLTQKKTPTFLFRFASFAKSRNISS